MSRSGYSDELDQSELAMWRGAVASSIRGKRGQKFLRDLLAALDAMPVKRLIAEQLCEAGEVCAIGSVGVARGVPELETMDPEDHARLSKTFDIARALVQEIEWVNDECGWGHWPDKETPEQRFIRVRKWVVAQLPPEGSKPCAST